MEDIRAKPRQIVLQDKCAEELGVPELDSDIPRQGNHAEKNNAGNPEGTPEKPVLSSAHCMERNEQGNKKDCYRSVGKSSGRDEHIKAGKRSKSPTLVPRIPAHQGNLQT